MAGGSVKYNIAVFSTNNFIAEAIVAALPTREEGIPPVLETGLPLQSR
jgi:hypothetical protein